MKINLFFIVFFGLYLAFQINGTDAVHKVTRSGEHNNNRVSISPIFLALALTSQASTSPYIDDERTLSETEKKLIKNASAVAFNHLKRFYMVAGRSRFG